LNRVTAEMNGCLVLIYALNVRFKDAIEEVNGVFKRLTYLPAAIRQRTI
jgi:hypothetical protein